MYVIFIISLSDMFSFSKQCLEFHKHFDPSEAYYINVYFTNFECLESHAEFHSFKGFIAILLLLISFFIHYDNNTGGILIPLPCLSRVFWHGIIYFGKSFICFHKICVLLLYDRKASALVTSGWSMIPFTLYLVILCLWAPIIIKADIQSLWV